MRTKNINVLFFFIFLCFNNSFAEINNSTMNIGLSILNDNPKLNEEFKNHEGLKKVCSSTPLLKVPRVLKNLIQSAHETPENAMKMVIKNQKILSNLSKLSKLAIDKNLGAQTLSQFDVSYPVAAFAITLLIPYEEYKLEFPCRIVGFLSFFVAAVALAVYVEENSWIVPDFAGLGVDLKPANVLKYFHSAQSPSGIIAIASMMVYALIGSYCVKNVGQSSCSQFRGKLLLFVPPLALFTVFGMVRSRATQLTSLAKAYEKDELIKIKSSVEPEDDDSMSVAPYMFAGVNKHLTNKPAAAAAIRVKPKKEIEIDWLKMPKEQFFSKFNSYFKYSTIPYLGAALTSILVVEIAAGCPD
eukprot:c17523_g1_i1.p1 GENE.c17523_g1_i1~~c17523_g1_i1.p1  ORF type:complete len:357 (+),score=111.56 c17523_g1_i1:68-1138(+)